MVIAIYVICFTVWETDNITPTVYMSDTIQMKCSKQCAYQKLLTVFTNNFEKSE